MSKLEDRLEGNASAWRPDQEDQPILLGKVLSVETGTSEYGPYPLIIVEDEATGEEKAIHAFHTVLRNELIRARPQPGERIGIKYLGEQDAKPGSPYKTYIGYRVRVEREQTSMFNWATLGVEEDTGEPITKEAFESVTVPADAGDDGIPFS